MCSDESVNSYGFKVLTRGIQLKNFKSNPVGFFNHKTGGSYWNPDPTYRGPIIRWEDITIDGTELKASPVFDINDPLGKTLSDKVENDFIRAASIGIRIVETSNDPALMEKGQTNPTITKCELMEISVVDIPSNKSALALFDVDGNRINLDDEKNLNVTLSAHLSAPIKIQNNNNNNMKLRLLSAWVALSAFFGVKHEEGKTETEFEATPEKLKELNDKLGALAQLQSEKDALAADKTGLQTQLNDLQQKLTKATEDLTTAQDLVAKLKAPANEPLKPVSDLNDKPNAPVGEGLKEKSSWQLKAERRSAALKVN